MNKPVAPRPSAQPSRPAGPVSSRVPVDVSTRTPINVGDVLNGKYLVEAIIGEGGVGLVAAAQNLELDERVALKFLRPEMLAQTDVVARFMREAKAACSIKSEYVASVYDVGTLPSGAPFLVMEYLDGKNLGQIVEERGRLGYREATEYVMQVCEALAVAHAKGVVHRDIKPENLFLTSRAGMSIVKVLDFGISKAALTGSIFGNALPLVKTVNLMGTPLYMSPEQVRSADTVDARSDIWSLGMVLYEILTGTLPFNASSITELCAAILEQPLESIRNHRNDLPAGYVEVLERCLEKDPSRRFQNVAEVAIAFMPFAPKRARICAERAAQALRAAGLVEESSVRFTSTVPPPMNDTSPSFGSGKLDASGAYPVGASGQPMMGSTGSVPAIPPAPGLPSVSAVPAATSVAVPASEPPVAEPRSRVKVFAAFVAVAALAAAVAAVTVSRLSAPEAPVAAPTPPATAPAEPAAGGAQATQVAPSTAGAAPTTIAVTSTAKAPEAQLPAADSPSKAAAGSKAATKPTYTWPPPKPAAAPPPKTSSSKKSSEEPDLGY